MNNSDFVVYMDFDGVLNVFKGDDIVKAEVTTRSKYLARKQYISWNPKIVNELIRVFQENNAHMVWVTTWCDQKDIQTASDLMGFPREMVSIATPDFVKQKSATKRDWTKWKCDFIINDLTSRDRPYIWIDDEAIKHWGNDLDWRFRSSYKFISPKGGWGLREEDVRDIEEWMRARKNSLVSS